MLGLANVPSRTAWIRATLLVCLFLGTAQTLPVMADYNAARAHFDGLPNDKRISISLGLIATGDFNGLIDFGFTKRYYNAVVAFERRERLTPDGVLEDWEVNRLNQAVSNFYGTLGFEFITHPMAGSKLFVPRQLFEQSKPTVQGYSFERNDKNLSISFVAYTDSEKSFTDLFETLVRVTPIRKIAYKRLRSNYFVVSGTFRKRNFYTWMSVVPGGSTGYTISWTDSWQVMGSKLSILLANSFVAIPTDTPSTQPPAERPEQGSASNSPPAPPQPTSGTGTGFQVSGAGHVLTNFHVAGQCKSTMLRKTGELPVSAELVASDATNDLALVKATQALGGTVAVFAGGPLPRAGADIAVFGFPRSDVLSESGNIVTGNISALSGFGNDSRHFQISAPIQPGNSGGPVLDRNGRIIAVVVSKLNAIAAIQDTGDVPQNVNFAIKANVAMNFLDGAGIAYQRQADSQSLDTPTIADTARGFTFLVECRN